MKKNSVRAAGKLHLPQTSDKYPHLPLGEPRPLCGLIGMGEDPEWSPLPANCEACERAKVYQTQQREIMPSQ